ncbi:pyridoxal phosphate-dependent decarboxylase family protein [Actinoplanes sp. NPDC049265]|uniref:pyridoxal phosphate-dependent decarboxylase family protein n=1 Tax=Actinoplanes sp. NPDC049265 TaxID=3363902 RepID=UPI00371AE3FD
MDALEAASAHARQWLDQRNTRPIPPRLGFDQLAARFSALPAGPTDPAAVIDLLSQAEPGLMGMNSGRFYGWVIGGVHPAGLGADWLTSAWDQNTCLRAVTPATAALEAVAGDWLLDLLGLPSGSAVGFVTGATMANFTGLAAGRHQVLADHGWDVAADGLIGAPPVRVLVGAERHDTVDLALRYLGLGRPTPVDVDDQGRIRVDALAAALDDRSQTRIQGASAGTEFATCPEAGDRPVIVCLQAGNLHSGAYDPFTEAIELAHARGAWVHVDGAFGLWAAASPGLRDLTAGVAGADSLATDAHKTLNVPYDCGIAIVTRPAALRTAVGVRASYMLDPADAAGPPDPVELTPEFSRRARGVPVWAVLRSLGRDGVAALVDGLVANARALADGIGALPGVRVLNDVAFTQVCFAMADDAATEAVTAALIRSGTVWMSGSRWRGRAVIRISVSNWATTAEDVATSIDTVRRAVQGV